MNNQQNLKAALESLKSQSLDDAFVSIINSTDVSPNIYELKRALLSALIAKDISKKVLSEEARAMVTLYCTAYVNRSKRLIEKLLGENSSVQ